MKTVKMQGGLGNQLFCLAFARSVAALTGAPVRLDLGPYGHDRYGRAFDLATLAESLGLATVALPVIGHRLAGALLRAVRPPLYAVEPRAAPDPAALARLARRGGYFDGYWQNEAFIAAPDETRALFGAFLRRAGGEGPVFDLAIHYRTYAEEIVPERRRTPDLAYFRAALEAVAETAGPPRTIALLSDDPDLAATRLAPLGLALTPVRGASAWADMALLLRARGLILTNSSFSWWAGWCADADRVVYPRRGDLHHYPRPAARFLLR